LSAAFDEISVEHSPLLLRDCRANLSRSLATEAVEKRHWWDRMVDAFTLPVMKPAGAVALVALGFFGARVAPGEGPLGLMSLAGVGASRVRSVEPSGNGQVRIVLDETRQRTVDGHMEDAEILELLLAASKDPSDGLRAETVALLNTRAQASGVRNMLVETIRNDDNAGVRLKALDGLKSFIREAEVRSALADVLAADMNPAMRIRAVDLLVESLDGMQVPTTDRHVIGVLQETISREQDAYMRQRCQRALELVKASAEIF
jgi:hypothetical protein